MCYYKIVLFSIVAFKTLTFHKLVWQHACDVVRSLVTVLLQMLFSDSDSEKSLKIGQYLMRLRRTKQCASFFGPPRFHMKGGALNSYLRSFMYQVQ